MIQIQSIRELADKYDAFILDLWGVIHDGVTPYNGVIECLEKLKKAHKKILLLSNAPRRSGTVVTAMEAMGISRDLYSDIVTSGEAAYQTLSLGKLEVAGAQLALQKNYLYLGLEKDRRILDGLDYTETKQVSDASFALVSHASYDNQPLSEIIPILNDCLEKNLPVICINPDLEVVRQTGERVYCAGVIAAEYERMGGQVIYFGKPHSLVYDFSFGLLQGIAKSNILAVGDTPRTDIVGANTVGLDTLLITGGVLASELGSAKGDDLRVSVQKIVDQAGARLDYVCHAFTW